MPGLVKGTAAVPLPTREELLELRDKYAQLVVLRQQRDALEARGVRRLHGAAAAARRGRVAALARRFPGALREIECGASVLRRRLALVEKALSAPALGVDPEVVLICDFHQAVRLHLDREAPRGLMEAVWCDLSRRHGCSVEALKLVLFGTTPHA